MTINRKIYFTNNKGFDSKVDPATFNFKIRIFDSKLNERLYLFSFYFMNLKSLAAIAGVWDLDLLFDLNTQQDVARHES